ncbi:flavin reductase [Micromonospora zingiberis]|uniref:Flavin reductase n=1 Tax=Micromonospora zingiberis TaxID=2053011 RepID=A0A4R0GJY5_9ACTN|nr:flavin reductase [Micromonospora zingiberis]TCB97127.1 flavin reductase [Micromonospora zingiberis]
MLAHIPSRPTWRCAACGIPWPCSPAKLRLLAEYKDDKPALVIYLVTLREEATAQLAELDSGTSPADLDKRLTDWVPVRPAT